MNTNSNGTWNYKNTSLPESDNDWNSKVRFNAVISLIVLVVVVVVVAVILF